MLRGQSGPGLRGDPAPRQGYRGLERGEGEFGREGWERDGEKERREHFYIQNNKISIYLYIYYVYYVYILCIDIDRKK